jgi:ABC-2 type transport system ATP-binding protein
VASGVSSSLRPPHVAVSGLTKTYGHLIALDRVSFTIRNGEVLGLIGPNGAGKTTLFECMAGLLPIDQGTVGVEGQTLTPRERVRRLFYVPDAIAPWPAQTLRWALDFTVGFFGGPGERRADVIERFDLAPFLDARIGTLSKGQRKRAVLAMGLLTPQPLLLADEPFDGLDLRQSREIGAALRAHAAGGRTLLLSIHSISDAARVCDRFVLLSGGRVCGEGTLEELTDAAAEKSDQTPASTLEDVFLALT